jgi:hypothetical protein
MGLFLRWLLDKGLVSPARFTDAASVEHTQLGIRFKLSGNRGTI